MRSFRFTFIQAVLCSVLAYVWATPGAEPLKLPLEIRQELTSYNFESFGGVPISSVTNSPAGSNGQAPSEQTGSVGTSNQFQGVITFGALAAPLQTNQSSKANVLMLDPSANAAVNAEKIGLPVGRESSSENSKVVIALVSARVGAPYISRNISYLFGSIISPPEADEYGVLLTRTNEVTGRMPTRPDLYWLSEPYTANGVHTNGYYWSINARKVFATEAGPVSIVWRRSSPSTIENPPSEVGMITNVTSTYVVFTNRYIVSGSALKPPRKIYWTEGRYRATGKPVDLPNARIDAVKIVYSRSFTEFVSTNQVETLVGESAVDGISNRTLWYQENQLRARNLEGRVLVEFLGALTEGEARVHLGYEIVDVIRQPNASKVLTELGERMKPSEDAPDNDYDLIPSPIISANVFQPPFFYQHVINESTRMQLYALRETTNVNDVLVHWLEKGIEGVLWPSRFVNYELKWPTDIRKYSQYIRPLVSTEEEAKTTAVPLSTANAPILEYQDALDIPRGKLTEKFEYYSFLTVQQPVHRALIRLSTGDNVAFERVFSWLETTLQNSSNNVTFVTGVENTFATKMAGWVASSNQLVFTNDFNAPRVENQTVNVGVRLESPLWERTYFNESDYLAGFIVKAHGDIYNPEAYIDPFEAGFEAAAKGAIIPVNARPGKDTLEVWWFRKNNADIAKGFKQLYWPSVISRYTVQWPQDADKIILASNRGSGPLSSLLAKGKIYYQNDKTLPGFNPNEEHALMQGGQVWALRDDLNDPNSDNSSAPYVLLSFEDTDLRPSMKAFKVLREDPQNGITFDYKVAAGLVLQAPMPLPLLDKPFAPKIIGTPPISLNKETGAWEVTANTAATVVAPVIELSTTTRPPGDSGLFSLQKIDQTGISSLWFYLTRNDNTSTQVQGVVSDSLPAAFADTFTVSPSDSTNFTLVNSYSTGPVLFISSVERKTWAAVMTSEHSGYFLAAIDSSAVTSLAGVNKILTGKTVESGDLNGWQLTTEPVVEQVPTTLRDRYAAFTFQDRKGNTWIYRGPHQPDQTEPAMQMQYYYKTLPGFFYPELALSQQPPVGTVTPYLRAVLNGSYVGDAVYGNKNNAQEGDGNPLHIAYRPYWPANVPVLQMAETLTVPKRGLPGIRGNTSTEILYQQSMIQGGESSESVVLHDPTLEKEFELGPRDGEEILGEIPPSVKTESYRGKLYFPTLPPHLAKRFFFDPTRGENGALVLRGEFVDAPLGDKYVLLNVMGPSEMRDLLNICPAEDTKFKGKWDAAIQGLKATLKLFVENPAKPGTYIPSTTTDIGVRELSRINNDDIAVDSYALTATGPGIGYVSLVMGNGFAFTPEGDPTSIKIIRVVDTLYKGEVNVIAAENPLNEKLTLQQVVDLAGQTENYRFEWKIAAPVDGREPNVYQTVATNITVRNLVHLPFLKPGDTVDSVLQENPDRTLEDIGTAVIAVSQVPFRQAVTLDDEVTLTLDAGHHLAAGNSLILTDPVGKQSTATVLVATPTSATLRYDPSQEIIDPVFQVFENGAALPVQSLAYGSFDLPEDKTYTQLWLGLQLDNDLGVRVYLDGNPVAVLNLPSGNTLESSAPSGLFTASFNKIIKLTPAILSGGQTVAGNRRHIVAVEFISGANPGTSQGFVTQFAAYESVDVTDQNWLPLDPDRYEDGTRLIMGGNADVRSLSDNYVIMRYQTSDPNSPAWKGGPDKNEAWSQWTTPALAEGWIKRVLAGINPFNQRITDLFNNRVNTDVSIIAQAGGRWEGDVALNLENLNNTGLIEIYETVMGRGKDLSINFGINYGPANDALLLAAGYLNDLYMMLGNEAWADAANPTIGIGTKDQTYGDIATSLFSFKGQVATLLDEELGLLRGRDDFLAPGVELRPVYNRLVWNFTRGIDSGEPIYTLNYNILDQNTDGVVDAEDALRLYPQGHGDAYGHYLTAVKGYYSLLMNTNFDWVPRIEAVNVLGKAVAVDYQDERKFAAASAALARAGKQIFDLTWRKDYEAKGQGWEQFEETRENKNTRVGIVTTRFWGMDHWASRVGQGSLVNWIVGNAILPETDPDPSHEGIQKVDRTTVPELRELPSIARDLQTAMDNAEGGLTPLGLPESAVPFDINPNLVVGAEPQTHFEQVIARAKTALNNAVVAFDDSKDVTRLMRSEQDSLADFRATVDRQELAYTNSLIEIYGTPYPEDIGPGATYRTGYAGPDLFHYMYVDSKELTFGGLLDPSQSTTWRIDLQTFPADGSWIDGDAIVIPEQKRVDGRQVGLNVHLARNNGVDGEPMSNEYKTNAALYLEYELDAHGYFEKPVEWTGRRGTPGKIQQAISDVIKSRNAAYLALYNADAAKYDLDWAILSLERKIQSHKKIVDFRIAEASLDQTLMTVKAAFETWEQWHNAGKEVVVAQADAASDALPKSAIFGVASGGDLTFAGRQALALAGLTTRTVGAATERIKFGIQKGLEVSTETAKRFIELNGIAPEEWNQQMRDETSNLRDKVYGVQNVLPFVNQRLQELEDARQRVQQLIASGERIQEEREIFRQRAAAVIQGYRTRDAAFRIFRNEKLERYKTLFDLAATYAFLAAKAYDYETGLLDTDNGREFINKIIASRAVGVFKNGEPQFGGSNTGDPGLSSALAEMQFDWQVLKGRLGLYNPDAYGTTVSLRGENFRILPGTDGDKNWQDVLHQGRKANILDDPDVRRYCMQAGNIGAEQVPGFVIEFSTTIADGRNLFGHPLAAGDHAFSPSSFATKLFGVGVALEGYQGMDNPSSISGALNQAQATSPSDPDTSFLSQTALSATPYVYLIPVGVDSMRSPALGDSSVVRTWAVEDVTIPLPFNIGGSTSSTKELWTSSESLSEPIFGIRKHQAFRPVSSASYFSGSIYTPSGGLQRSQYTNNRLIGRSAWNSKWKIVIPGRTLLENPAEGMDRFVNSVKDIKLHLVTYSYSGN